MCSDTSFEVVNNPIQILEEDTTSASGETNPDGTLPSLSASMKVLLGFFLFVFGLAALAGGDRKAAPVDREWLDTFLQDKIAVTIDSVLNEMDLPGQLTSRLNSMWKQETTKDVSKDQFFHDLDQVWNQETVKHHLENMVEAWMNKHALDMVQTGKLSGFAEQEASETDCEPIVAAVRASNWFSGLWDEPAAFPTRCGVAKEDSTEALIPEKRVAVGGKGGTPFDDLDEVTRIFGSKILKVARVEIWYNNNGVSKISPTFLLENGDQVSLEHGNKRPSHSLWHTVVGFQDRTLVRVDIRKGDLKLYQIAFWDSNGKIYGPFGSKSEGAYYSFRTSGSPGKSQILAFHGNSGNQVDKLGVIVQ